MYQYKSKQMLPSKQAGTVRIPNGQIDKFSGKYVGVKNEQITECTNPQLNTTGIQVVSSK